MKTPLSVRCAIGMLFVQAATAQVSWTMVANSGAPLPLSGCAWDAIRNRLVAFGATQGTPPGSTLEWNGTTWVVLNPAVRPSPRSGPGMAYDGARQDCVMFGGTPGPGTATNETWTWNGTTWTQRFPASAPSRRLEVAMAYDSVRQVVVMFGGWVLTATMSEDSNQTWEWNGTTWTQRTSAGATPSARQSPRMVFDQARGKVVMCGGFSTANQTTLGDTWTWDGTTWTPAASLPGTMQSHALVYDGARQRVVLWGGRRVLPGPVVIDLDDTHEWDGTSWTQRLPAVIPGARSAAVYGFDTQANRVLVAGGVGPGGLLADTFAYAPSNPGSFASFGTGCASSAGSVELDSVSLPYIGSSFVHQIGNAPPTAAVGVIAYGLSNTIWNTVPLPLPLAAFGAPGCFLLVSADTTVATALVGGTGTIAWNIPNQPSLVGQQLFLQAFVHDPLSPLALPIGTSSGRIATVGAP